MRNSRDFSLSFVIFFCVVGASGGAFVACGSSDSAAGGSVAADAAGAADGAGTTRPEQEGGGTTAPGDAAAANDGSAARDSGVVGDAATGCPRTAAAADRARRLVISHPFGADAGNKATAFEVLGLSQTGTLTRPTPQVTFAMGTALDTPIVFTPDGEIGLVAQDDGSIGVFRLPAIGAPTVLHAAFIGGFYAGGLVVSPDGTRVYVLDSNTRANGGGVYEVLLNCDGTLGKTTLIVPGSGASAMALLPTDPTKAVLAATAAFDSTANQDVHLVDLVAHTRIASAAAFGDGMAIVSSLDVAPDGKFAVLADDGLDVGNRIATVALTAGAIAPVSIATTPYPDGVAFSPFDNAGIVLNDDSTDQIHVLTYDPASATLPIVIKGELAYKFGAPQIPITISPIAVGALKGTTFVGENTAVRQITFAATGDVTDTAKLEIPGGGDETIVGVVGVQP